MKPQYCNITLFFSLSGQIYNIFPIYFLAACTAAAPTDGTADNTTPAHGATVTYGCNPGYTLAGPSTLTCSAGALSGTEPTCAGSMKY